MALSPMMQHYLQTKEKHKDAVLFYRLGDFYEFFFEDAIEMSRVLDLTLTGKACGLEEKAPMCGIPEKAAAGYIEKLVKLGYKVAICEQLTQPKKGVKIVERDVVRIVTSGTLVEENMLDSDKNNYIACVFEKAGSFGVAYSEVTKGEFYVYQIKGKNTKERLNDLLVRISPSEIICNESAKQVGNTLYASKLGMLPNFASYFNWAFEKPSVSDNLTKQFGKNYEKVYQTGNMALANTAAGALMAYLGETQKTTLHHINKILIAKLDNFMMLDVNTKRNLELTETIKDRRKKGTLLWLLDNTKTAMGARMFRDWVANPLYDSKEINLRLDAVEELSNNLIVRESIIAELSKVRDIERIVGRIATSGLHPKHCLSLKDSLAQAPVIKGLLQSFKSDKLTALKQNILDFSQVKSLLESAIDEEASSITKDGNYIKKGFNKELDELRNISKNGLDWLANLEAEEREKTGIKNLRISFNRVHGYFIEVNKSQTALVPLYYERRQTIANNERYITPELKEIEEKILNASDLAIKLEHKLFAELRERLIEEITKLQILGKTIAELDSLVSLTTVAVKNNYCKPKISSRIKHIKIVEGRHPVVEAFSKDVVFIANDTYLDDSDNKTMIITGPNMAGKSTYMRQVAVITLLAHIGSFVPAKQAEISLTDRIFTRVGASDDLAFGQSTFMVEMSEVATILNNATGKSLIILDEIGRGTSTFDGLSIAWAVVEYLSQNMNAKTLFATHYHELTELEGLLEGVKNYKILLKEINGEIIFLRKIVRGGASRSFGIEVASLAGLPQDVILRAKAISKELEENDIEHKINTKLTNDNTKGQENMKLAKEVVSILNDINIESISPLTAFEMLLDLVKKVKD